LNRPPSSGSGRAVRPAKGVEVTPVVTRRRDGMSRPLASPVAGLLADGVPEYKSGTGDGLHLGGLQLIGKSLSAAGATGWGLGRNPGESRETVWSWTEDKWSLMKPSVFAWEADLRHGAARLRIEGRYPSPMRLRFSLPQARFPFLAPEGGVGS
jgi:hypothetical protein